MKAELSNSAQKRITLPVLLVGSSSQKALCFAYNYKAIGNAMYDNQLEVIKDLSPGRYSTSRKFKAKPKLI